MQWFGNLVTMSWWNDLWLNEGFATYIEYLGAESSQDSSFLSNFYTETIPYAFNYDGRLSSHPLSLQADSISSSDDIEGIFDAIEYQKGASILRMVRSWINRDNMESKNDQWELSFARSGPTADKFLAGLHSYLLQHSYRNASASSLWQSVGEAIDVDLAPIMEEWTFHKGYPVVTVTMDAKGNIKVQQARYLEQEKSECDGEDLWWIPINYISSDSTTQVKWSELNSCQSLRPLTTLPKDGWVKVNAQQYGFYRVNYSPALWNRLKSAVGEKDLNGFHVMGGIDVAGLLEDSFHLAGIDSTSMDIFLDIFR